VRSAMLVLALSLGGCVYPATEPTGVEFSWRFVEHDLAEGEPEPRVRTCEGALTEQVAIEVRDVDTPDRQGIFRFDCFEGYQTATDLQTEASDAFVRLDPGAYAISLWAVDDRSDASRSEQLETHEVVVEDRGVTIAPWEVSRAPVAWALELLEPEACDTLVLALYYANPQLDLAEFMADEADQSLPLYRPGLGSDRGLRVDGQPTPCDPDMAGAHVFEGIDRAEYLLDVAVDGRVCSLRVDLRAEAGASSVIDLANLPCGG